MLVAPMDGFPRLREDWLRVPSLLHPVSRVKSSANQEEGEVAGFSMRDCDRLDTVLDHHPSVSSPSQPSWIPDIILYLYLSYFHFMSVFDFFHKLLSLLSHRSITALLFLNVYSKKPFTPLQ